MNGGFKFLRRLPLAYHKWIHLIVGFRHTKGYEGLHGSPLRGVTERPAADNVQRPVDISSRSESRDYATAPNGVLLATTDRSVLHMPPLPAPFGRMLSSGAPRRQGGRAHPCRGPCGLNELVGPSPLA